MNWRWTEGKVQSVELSYSERTFWTHTVGELRREAWAAPLNRNVSFTHRDKSDRGRIEECICANAGVIEMRIAIMQREKWGRIDHWFWRGSGGHRRAFDFQSAVDLCCLPSTICIPLRVSEVGGVLVLLFRVIHRAFIAFVKILTVRIQCTFIEVAAADDCVRTLGNCLGIILEIRYEFTKFRMRELARRSLSGLSHVCFHRHYRISFAVFFN